MWYMHAGKLECITSTLPHDNLVKACLDCLQGKQWPSLGAQQTNLMAMCLSNLPLQPAEKSEGGQHVMTELQE